MPHDTESGAQTPASAPPPSVTGPAPNNGRPTPVATQDDLRFVQVLRKARLLGELGPNELRSIFAQLQSSLREARCLDILQVYYSGGGDRDAGLRRTKADRFFSHSDRDTRGATEVLGSLAELTPELDDLVIERIGGDEGALCLRSGERLSPVLDAYEEYMDTDEIDIRDLENDRPTVSVHALVRALNRLLKQVACKVRLVEVRSDGSREAYLAVALADARALFEAGYLEDETDEEMLDFASW